MRPSLQQLVVPHFMRGVLALAFLFTVGCGFFPEASFSLASESRLPKWFKQLPGQTRANATVTMDYYVSSSGRTATFTLRDSSGTTTKVTGKLRTVEPLQRMEKQSGFPAGYPVYEIIAVGGKTEIIEHRKMEPVFYVTDDPAVWAEFSSHV